MFTRPGNRGATPQPSGPSKLPRNCCGVMAWWKAELRHRIHDDSRHVMTSLNDILGSMKGTSSFLPLPYHICGSTARIPSPGYHLLTYTSYPLGELNIVGYTNPTCVSSLYPQHTSIISPFSHPNSWITSGYGVSWYSVPILKMIWVNYNISLTFIVGPFGDDFPY